MVHLSVNINKIALIRNARGANLPDINRIAIDCERYGAQGITVHPRPDQRHIRFDDLDSLKKILTTEFNIEGYPSRQFIDLVCAVKPAQVTLVPDPPDALTSSAGWDTVKHQRFLCDVISEFQKNDIRTSIFIDPDSAMIEQAAATGTNRVELYTESYARQYQKNREEAISPYIIAAKTAVNSGLGLNAGHDLNLDNLAFFNKNIPGLLEVSIGHALVCDALYFGLQNTIGMYLQQLR
ncbi:MAG: pyridoxine 5'-phosphate synthase [Bacteroidota bacterium]